VKLKFVPTSPVAAFMAAVLILLTPDQSRAQATTLDFTLTATYQQPNRTSSSGVDTISSTKTVKWKPDTILTLLTNSLGISLTKDSYLAQDNNTVEIIIDNGLDDTNVSSLVSFNTSGTQVGSGTVNGNTAAQSSASVIYATATFNDNNGNTFNVSGLLHETVTLTARDSSGNQTETISFSGSVTGYGTVVDSDKISQPAVFSGVVSGAGKGPSGT
jgi:hypothetical protein